MEQFFVGARDAPFALRVGILALPLPSVGRSCCVVSLSLCNTVGDLSLFSHSCLLPLPAVSCPLVLAELVVRSLEKMPRASRLRRAIVHTAATDARVFAVRCAFFLSIPFFPRTSSAVVYRVRLFALLLPAEKCPYVDVHRCPQQHQWKARECPLILADKRGVVVIQRWWLHVSRYGTHHQQLMSALLVVLALDMPVASLIGTCTAGNG